MSLVQPKLYKYFWWNFILKTIDMLSISRPPEILYLDYKYRYRLLRKVAPIFETVSTLTLDFTTLAHLHFSVALNMYMLELESTCFLFQIFKCIMLDWCAGNMLFLKYPLNHFLYPLDPCRWPCDHLGNSETQYLSKMSNDCWNLWILLKSTDELERQEQNLTILHFQFLHGQIILLKHFYSFLLLYPNSLKGLWT